MAFFGMPRPAQGYFHDEAEYMALKQAPKAEDGQAPKAEDSPVLYRNGDRYRDPLPGEDIPDDPLLRFLPPERQRYWRQVKDEGAGGDRYVTARLGNYVSSTLHTEVIGSIMCRLAESLERLEKRLR